MKYSIRSMMKDAKSRQECCICGKEFSGYGNNPWPVMSEGRCCDECNFDTVLPARLAGTSKKVKAKDSIDDLNRLIESEDEAIKLYEDAIKNAGDGLEKSIYEEILKDEKEHLEKLNALKTGYDNSARIQ